MRSHAKAHSAATAWVAAATALFFSLLALAITSAPAFAVTSRPYLETLQLAPIDGDPANDSLSGTLLAGGARYIALDSTGEIYISSENGVVAKYDQSQIGANAPNGSHIYTGSVAALATDLSSDHLLIDRGESAVEYDPSGAEVLEIAGFGGSEGAAFHGGKLYISQRLIGSILVFGSPTQLPVEQAPFSASGPLLIFNGAPKGGKQVLIFHVYAHVPAPTTFVTTALISKHGGKYGTEAEVTIPTIVGGQGSLTSFTATLKKSWTYKGKKENLLLASCPTGSLTAHGEFTFVDGTRAAGDVVRPCVGVG